MIIFLTLMTLMFDSGDDIVGRNYMLVTYLVSDLFIIHRLWRYRNCWCLQDICAADPGVVSGPCFTFQQQRKLQCYFSTENGIKKCSITPGESCVCHCQNV